MGGTGESRPTDSYPLMRAILDSAPQGFSVWSLDFRLVVCNRAYLDIYGFSPEEVGPGTSLEAVARLTVAMGNHPDSTPGDMHARYLQRLSEARSTGRPVPSRTWTSPAATATSSMPLCRRCGSAVVRGGIRTR